MNPPVAFPTVDDNSYDLAPNEDTLVVHTLAYSPRTGLGIKMATSDSELTNVWSNEHGDCVPRDVVGTNRYLKRLYSKIVNEMRRLRNISDARIGDDDRTVAPGRQPIQRLCPGFLAWIAVPRDAPT